MTFEKQKRRSFLAKSALLGGTLLTGTGVTAAADHIVVDQSDPSAYDSIQRAVYDAPDGATVQVASGTYEGDVWVPSSKSLVIRGDPGGDEPGAGPDAPVLDGEGATQSAGFFLESGENAPELVIEGLVIRNYGQDLYSPGIPDDEWGGGIRTSIRSNVTIRDVSMDHIAGPGVGVGGDGQKSARNWLVQRCQFDSIAHTAILLSSVVNSTVKNNEVTASDPVPDAEGQWWEENTPDGNPVFGIKIQTGGPSHDQTTVSKNVLIEENEVTGRFDSAGIKLFSYNTGGRQTLLSQVTIRDNTVELTDVGDDSIEPEEKHGIILDANPGLDWLPAAIRDVLIEGNTVIGANHAYKFNAMAPFTSDSETMGGVRNVVCRNNRAVECRIASIPLTLRQGNLSGVTIEDNTFERCGNGIVLWSRGRTLSDVDIRGNVFDHGGQSTEPDGLGIEAVGYGSDIDGVRVSESTFQNYSRAVIAYGLEDGNVRNVEITDCTIAGNDIGMASYGYPGESTLELSAKHTTFTNNRIGVVNLENASAADLHVHLCDFQNHTEFAAKNGTGTGVLDATCNYWGHPTGPSHEHSRVGRGEAVTAGVNYDPLLPQSFERVSENACHPAPGKPPKQTGKAGASTTDHSAHGPKK